MPTMHPTFHDELVKLGDDWVAAIEAAPMPSLGDGPRDAAIAKMLRSGIPFATPLSDRADAACRAGLWLLAGDLEASHRISQSDESAEGSFWHGIMHRREGDFDNAKYWFRRVGAHSVAKGLESHRKGNYGDLFSFVDCCRDLSRSGGDPGSLEIAQWFEWQSLMAFCVAV